MRILVLTDASEYGTEATLYPLLRAAAARPEVEAVLVADRAIAENKYFYEALDKDVRHLHVRAVDSHFAFENQHDYPPQSIDIRDVDAVWLRLDLVSDAFLHYVEDVWGDRFISNRPSGIIRTGTKAFLLELQPQTGGLMPRIKLCNGLDDVRAFQADCPDTVLKVLRSFGGHGVMRVRKSGESDLATDDAISAFFAENGPCLAMEYLHHPQQSDNRLIVSNGKILGTLARVPKQGDWRCNITVGGTYRAAEAQGRELDIVRLVDPTMRSLGVHFYGVDTLQNEAGERFLSEINTMNVGGAYRFELATGTPVCRQIADDFVDNALAAKAAS